MHAAAATLKKVAFEMHTAFCWLLLPPTRSVKRGRTNHFGFGFCFFCICFYSRHRGRGFLFVGVIQKKFHAQDCSDTSIHKSGLVWYNFEWYHWSYYKFAIALFTLYSVRIVRIPALYVSNYTLLHLPGPVNVLRQDDVRGEPHPQNAENRYRFSIHLMAST